MRSFLCSVRVFHASRFLFSSSAGSRMWEVVEDASKRGGRRKGRLSGGGRGVGKVFAGGGEE